MRPLSCTGNRRFPNPAIGRRLALATLPFLLTDMSQAMAQTVVDPGAVVRDNELAPPFDLERAPVDTGARDLSAVPVEALAPGPRVTPSTPAPDAPRIPVSGVRFTGNTLFDAARLEQALGDFAGRDLTFAEIEDATRSVADFYTDQGYLATATLPPQEVTDGIVTIEIEEARFGGVVFEGLYPQRVNSGTIQGFFDRRIAVGQPLRPEAFDRALLLANDLPGVNLSGSFAPGRNPGETVLILNVTDDPIGRALVSVDNLGSRATGEERASARVNLISPLGIGDFLQGTVTKSEGILSGQARYSVPVGSSGLRALAHIDALDYEVVADEFAALDSEGTSFEYGAGLSYPLLRGRDANLTITLDHDRKRLENDVLGAMVSDYSVDQTTLGLNGTLFDDFGGGGASSFGLSATYGIAEGVNGTGRFDDDFVVGRVTASRQQYLTDKTTLFASVSAQAGPRDLDSSESFSLGGPLGVRAYPTGEASGPTGFVASLEIRRRILDDWTLKGFVDYGHIYDRDTTGQPSSYALKGAGVSVGWDAPWGFRADLTYAHRIGSNPNPITATGVPGLVGNDQDGSLDRNRVWFTLNKSF